MCELPLHRLRRGLPRRLFSSGPEFPGDRSEVCIDCTLCVAECPVEAICEASEVPEGQEHFVELNARYSQLWPVITDKTEPLPTAEEWSSISNKLGELKEA